jgi:hypothetical protein
MNTAKVIYMWFGNLLKSISPLEENLNEGVKLPGHDEQVCVVH